MIHVDPALIAPGPVPAAAPAATPADARARIEGQLVMLDRLAAIGMEIAEACGREAKAPPAEAAARSHPGLVFARVARAVRMTIALQSRLMKDLAALDRADEVSERARTTKRRTRLAQLIEDAARAKLDAQREAGSRFWADEDAIEDEIETLTSEAYERLIDAEDGDLWGRPFDAVVAAVCKDLGLSPDWTARIAASVQPPPTSPTRSVAGLIGEEPIMGPSAEEPMVEGASPKSGPGPQHPWPSPSTVPSSGAGPHPAIAAATGEVDAAQPRAPP
jgi:hypothetical protein